MYGIVEKNKFPNVVAPRHNYWKTSQLLEDFLHQNPRKLWKILENTGCINTGRRQKRAEGVCPFSVYAYLASFLRLSMQGRCLYSFSIQPTQCFCKNKFCDKKAFHVLRQKQYTPVFLHVFAFLPFFWQFFSLFVFVPFFLTNNFPEIFIFSAFFDKNAKFRLKDALFLTSCLFWIDLVLF